MSAKRKTTPTTSTKIVQVQEKKQKTNLKNDYSSSEKMLNTTKLLFMLSQSDFLQPVTDYVQSIGTNGFDIFNVPGRERIYATNQIFKALSALDARMRDVQGETSVEYKEQNKKLNTVMDYLIHPFGTDSTVNNMIYCSIAENFFWCRHDCFKASSPSIKSVPPGEEHGIVNIIHRLETTTAIVTLVSYCSDSYLNIVSVTRSHSLMTPLKAAASRGMYDVAESIIRRFPAVDFDVVHPDLPLAEPVRLSIDKIKNNDHMTNLIQVGESIVQKYYEDLNKLLASLKHENYLSDSNLLNIVWSYAKRMPLSTTLLSLPAQIK